MPRATAGSPSVIRLIHRIWVAERNRQPEQRGQQHHPDLARVGEQVPDEAPDIVVDAPTFLDSGDYRCEVVVGEDQCRRVARRVCR